MNKKLLIHIFLLFFLLMSSANMVNGKEVVLIRHSKVALEQTEVAEVVVEVPVEIAAKVRLDGRHVGEHRVAIREKDDPVIHVDRAIGVQVATAEGDAVVTDEGNVRQAGRAVAELVHHLQVFER